MNVFVSGYTVDIGCSLLGLRRMEIRHSSKVIGLMLEKMIRYWGLKSMVGVFVQVSDVAIEVALR